ncbi:cyclophilin-like fold protein [Pseudomonas sp. Ant30-3]|uniref:cyclophilin-like fold protein n=1 Tax=Pseudomonas sp. Ant30-3 TaxID=1488328 RepID=UPI001EEEF145|nr:cyclophilin-like fold protein [Pseudomonas sp. Ant30-3]
MHTHVFGADHVQGWKGLWLAALMPLAFSASPLAAAKDIAGPSTGMENTSMWMTVGEQRFAIALEDTPTTWELVARLPLSVNMTELHKNEKFATLQPPLPTQAYRPGTIHTGDLLLYGADTLVVFYKTFTSSYSYSRIGRVDNPADLAKALGRDDVRVTFSVD